MTRRLTAVAFALGIGSVAASSSVRAERVPLGIDVLFAVCDDGGLAPIAARENGAFLPAPTDGGFDTELRRKARVALADAGGRLHLIFGRRIVANASTADGTRVALPPAMPLRGGICGLASPTFGARATHPRRRATADERRDALALAAAKLATTPSHLVVRNLTAIDLGGGIAIVGSADARGSGTPREAVRLFFVAETVAGKRTLALANLQRVTVTEPLLEETGEYLVDAFDLEPGRVALVTHVVGYDAGFYAIYVRSGATWRLVHAGGGFAG